MENENTEHSWSEVEKKQPAKKKKKKAKKLCNGNTINLDELIKIVEREDKEAALSLSYKKGNNVFRENICVPLSDFYNILDNYSNAEYRHIWIDAVLIYYMELLISNDADIITKSAAQLAITKYKEYDKYFV